MRLLHSFAISALITVGSIATSTASAAWPQDQAIRVVVPQAAGGTNDTVARLISNELAKRLQQTVIVENRPGAAGAIGMQTVTQARPDGYTLGIASDSATILGAVRQDLPWDFRRDLVGIAMIGDQPIGVAVSAKTPYRSFADVVAAAKKAPGTLGFGTSGPGSSQHIVGEWLARLAGIELIHVPYKGGGQAVSDLAAGQVPIAVLGSAPLMGQHRAGLVRIVAVSSAQRSPSLPEVPTLTELGYKDIALAQWAGFVAPRGIPQEVSQRLSDEIRQIVAMPEIRKKLAESGLDPRYMDARSFDEFLGKTIDGWKTQVGSLKLQLN